MCAQFELTVVVVCKPYLPSLLTHAQTHTHIHTHTHTHKHTQTNTHTYTYTHTHTLTHTHTHAHTHTHTHSKSLIFPKEDFVMIQSATAVPQRMSRPQSSAFLAPHGRHSIAPFTPTLTSITHSQTGQNSSMVSVSLCDFFFAFEISHIGEGVVNVFEISHIGEGVVSVFEI